jgi:hypothetical protein
MTIGHKGMLAAAKTLSLTAIDLFTTPDEIAAAKRDGQDQEDLPAQILVHD